MPQVKPPAIEPMAQQISDIERFAKAYFSITLTKQQLEVMKAVIQGKDLKLVRRRAGSSHAQRVLHAYMLEGLKPDGRARLPQFELPAHLGRTKVKAKTQHGRVLEMIKRPGGAFNFELSRIACDMAALYLNCEKMGITLSQSANTLRMAEPATPFCIGLQGSNENLFAGPAEFQCPHYH